MKEYKALSNPPIKEAQITVQFFKNITLEDIEKGMVGLNNEYSKIERYYTFTHTLNIGGKKLDDTPVQQKQIGFKLSNESANKGVVIGESGITFSYINSYGGWTEFESDFWALLAHLKNNGLDPNLKQIGVRFINRLLFNKGEDLVKYLKLLPDFPQNNFSSYAENFVMRYNMREDNGARSSINFLFQGLDKESKLVFNFDVSAFLDKTTPVKADTLKEDLEYLRQYKNDIFFNSVTEDLVARYNV